jgi:hypothetical protein
MKDGTHKTIITFIDLFPLSKTIFMHDINFMFIYFRNFMCFMLISLRLFFRVFICTKRKLKNSIHKTIIST